MKKIAAAVAAVLCVMGCAAVVPFSGVPAASDVSIVASAATTVQAVPGINAGKYSYKYADTSVNPHTIAEVKYDVKSKNESIKEAAVILAGAEGKGHAATKKGTGGLMESFYQSEGYKLGVYSVTVKDGDETITEYHVGLAGIKESILDLNIADIAVPAEFESYVEKAFENAKLVDPKHVTMIAPSAFAGKDSTCYLKTIDMTGVQYIGKSAFANAAYITEITIPKTVKYVGDNAFENSGLKTLAVQNEMPIIPVSLCKGTKLTKITFAHPEFIRVISENAFASTPIGEPLFNSWGDVAAKGYETLVVNDSAYENCQSIAKVEMPDTLVRLNQKCFKGCTKLYSIKFGKETRVADIECFANCTALDNVAFNTKLTSLGTGVFSGCTALKAVDIQAKMEDWVEIDKNTGVGFGTGMFAGDTSLKTVILPDTLTRIPEATFEGCTSLTSVNGSSANGNTNIVMVEDNAFRNCTSLLEIEYPELAETGESAFEGCTSLVEANFPKLRTIGKRTFANCSKMTKFAVGVCLEVGDNALEGCTSLKNIELMSKEYGKYVFKNCAGAEMITVNGAGLGKIPEGMFSECTVLKNIKADFTKTAIIGKNAFYKCEALEKTQFANVRIVEDSAFADCTSLVSITSGNKPITAEDYGAKCFQNCTALQIQVDGVISTIGANAFQNSGITKVNLDGMSGGTVVINANAFSDCANLTEAKISAANAEEFSVGKGLFSGSTKLHSAVFDGTIIVQEMFKGCTGLTYVDTNATSIQANAFNGCTMLEGLYTIDHGARLVAKDIANGAFSGCTVLAEAPSNADTSFSGTQQFMNCAALKSVETSSLTSGMFNGCASLEKVDVVGGVNIIPDKCFANCTSLAVFDLSGMDIINANAFNGSGIQSVKVESGQTIGSGAFQNCADLKTIDVNVTLIERQAFAGCSFLNKADICAEKINASAFQNCSSLKEVNLKNSETHTLESIGNQAFDGCGVLYELVVPGSPEIGKNSFGFTNGKVNPDFLVIGETGSSVQEYAEKYKMNFADVDGFDMAARKKTHYTPGDVDGNGVISAVDCVKLQKWILRKASPGLFAENMDLNGDGVSDIFDLALLKHKLSKK